MAYHEAWAGMAGAETGAAPVREYCMIVEPPLPDAAVLLRAHRLRVTPQRVVVLETLQRTRGHMSVEEIHAIVRAQHPSLCAVTVYRVLELLESHGLVARGQLGDKVSRWELVAEAHHHLICRRCGDVVELGDEPFQDLAVALNVRYQVRVNLRHLSLEGLCNICAAQVDDPLDETKRE